METELLALNKVQQSFKRYGFSKDDSLSCRHTFSSTDLIWPFQVGNEMVSNGIRRCQMIGYMVTLAMVTPIGMIIGIILTIHVDGESGWWLFFQSNINRCNSKSRHLLKYQDIFCNGATFHGTLSAFWKLKKAHEPKKYFHEWNIFFWTESRFKKTTTQKSKLRCNKIAQFDNVGRILVDLVTSWRDPKIQLVDN